MKLLSRLLPVALVSFVLTAALTVFAAPPPPALDPSSHPGTPPHPTPPAHLGPRDVRLMPPITPPPGNPAGEHGAAPAGEHKAEHEEGPGPINWQDFGNKDQPPYAAAIINFALLAFIYFYFGRKPIAAALKTRRDGVAKQIEEAQKMKREAEERSKQYTEKLGDLTTELAKTKAALAEAGAGEKQRIVREAEEKAVRMEKEAVFLLEQEAKQMQADLQREAVAAALHRAEELLASKITTADQERMAEEFLATLVPQKSGHAAGGAS
jgi:F-type H+-transporting ATPase subunit b